MNVQKSRRVRDRPWQALPASVAAAMREFVPGTADEIIDAIREEVPAYSRPLSGAFGDGIRTGVERSLMDFLDEVEGRPRQPDGGGRDIYRDLGRGEVREGRTMEALLAAYRVGARVAWRSTAAAGRRAGFDADTLALLAEAIFAYIDELSARSAQGFAEEQSAAAGEAARRRRALLGLLVQGPPVEPTAIRTAANQAAWELPSRLAALVWRDESEQPVARRLPLGSLTAPLDDGLVCALVPDADAPGRRGQIERALSRRQATLGPTVPWPETWRTARRARAVHVSLPEALAGDSQVVEAEEHLADLIVHGDPELLEELAALALKPLERRTDASREKLLDTLAAWLDHHGNVAQVANVLHVHPQTVRYRVGQLREALGERLEDPAARFELSLALRAPR